MEIYSWVSSQPALSVAPHCWAKVQLFYGKIKCILLFIGITNIFYICQIHYRNDNHELLQKFFSKNPDTTGQQQSESPGIDGIYTDEYFRNRYTEDELLSEDVLVDGSFRMLSSFFIDNKVTLAIENPVYHPNNIDKAVTTEPGFYQYCKSFDQEDKQIGLMLTIAFSYYMIHEFGFKLYRDKTPEFPLRFMTLKYDNNGGVISLYPFEYSLKVLNGEALFSDLLERIKSNLGNLPSAEDLLTNFKQNLSQE